MHLESDLSKKFDVHIDAIWTATLSPFNYSTDISPIAMSEAVALEPWSRKYFDDLKRWAHSIFIAPLISNICRFQSSSNTLWTIWRCTGHGHCWWQSVPNPYMRTARPHIRIEKGLETIPSLCDSFLSIGERRRDYDWRRFGARDVLQVKSNHPKHSRNRDCDYNFWWFFFSVGISYRIVIGYVSSASDKTNVAINKCDIELYQFGANPPKQYAFSFWTGECVFNHCLIILTLFCFWPIERFCFSLPSDDNQYVVEVNTRTETELYMGEESECRLVEKWCNFKVNGVAGWGAAEWQYKNDSGRVRTPN